VTGHVTLLTVNVQVMTLHQQSMWQVF
jgi:hypothetical protein